MAESNKDCHGISLMMLQRCFSVEKGVRRNLLMLLAGAHCARGVQAVQPLGVNPCIFITTSGENTHSQQIFGEI